ncbi:alpha/beta hydrolase [Saccharicrinis sp. GN24d3]|uniref:alpha/beta hydrolase n=1 Tax=Saccharicrinis sp. GN24d3 TaxID=3458416 RepID=UPI004035FF6A
MKKHIMLLMLILGIGSIAHAQKTSFHTAAAKAPEAGSMFIFPERILLENGGFLNAERATMFVPLNRSEENSDVISLDVYRFKATEKADPNTPPIFYLFGGPRFGGLEEQLEVLGYFEQTWQFMTNVADVVVVSQRGIGPSKPTTLIENTRNAQPTDVAFNDEAAVKDYQALLTSERNVWENLGVDLKGFTVVEAAEDVNDVRKALGYDKITLWGGSFGSHWGMSLMRMHPEIIERAILRGLEGPDHTYDHPGHTWNVYKRMAEEAESSEELKGLIPEGGLIAAVETIVKRLNENPVTVELENPVTKKMQKVLFDGHTVKQLTRGYSGSLEAWPADIITMYNGDFTKAAQKIIRRWNDQGKTYKTASYFMLDCGSGITPERSAEHLADPATELIETAWGYRNGCPCWDSDLGNEFRQNFECEIPTVMVQGTWDRSTPYENALELAPYFKNLKFVHLKRGPHGAIKAALKELPEFKKAILKFAASGDDSDLEDNLELSPLKWVVPE